NLSMRVGGGVSGARSTSGFPPGGPSPDSTGADGLITFAHIDASALTIGPSRTIPRGSVVHIVTKLVDLGAVTPIARQSVTVYRRASKSDPWSKLATRTTSATGGASVSVAPTKFTQYQWRFAGGWVNDPTTSAKQSISIASGVQ